MITSVYDLKESMHELGHFCTWQENEDNPKDYQRLKELDGGTTGEITNKIKIYRSMESQTATALTFLSCNVYKCVTYNNWQWRGSLERKASKEFLARSFPLGAVFKGRKRFKNDIPHKSVSAVAVITDHVTPFLLGVVAKEEVWSLLEN